MTKPKKQRALCCPCGNGKVLALGLCGTCYTLKWQDEAYFGGLREQVLQRDGYACRGCGEKYRKGNRSVVHHRVPGLSLLDLMITLCTKCHAKVERTKIVLAEMNPLLLELWRERHPEAKEQLFFDFSSEKPTVEMRRLFEEKDGRTKDEDTRELA